jgi:hypothetical protein
MEKSEKLDRTEVLRVIMSSLVEMHCQLTGENGMPCEMALFILSKASDVFKDQLSTAFGFTDLEMTEKIIQEQARHIREKHGASEADVEELVEKAHESLRRVALQTN